jgi:hypothetical protein
MKKRTKAWIVFFLLWPIHLFLLSAVALSECVCRYAIDSVDSIEKWFGKLK